MQSRRRPHTFTRRIGRAAVAVAAFLGCATAEARAQTPSQGWQWSIAPYVWTTDVGLDAALNDGRSMTESIAFTDIVKDLEMAAQIRIEGQRGAHGFMFDLFGVRLGRQGDRYALPSGGEAVLDSSMDMSIIDVGGIYDPRGDQQGLAFLYGSRILYQKAAVDAETTLFPSTGITHHEAADTLVDALVGARYIGRLSARWSYVLRADASVGGTDGTWSGAAAIAYSFGRNQRYSATVGYRHLAIGFKNDEPVDHVDMALSGFITGLRVAF